MMRKISLVISLALFTLTGAFGQVPAQAVNQVGGVPPNDVVEQLFYDGNGNLIYDCVAPHNAPSNANQWSTALSNLTNITVNANVGTINFAATAQVWVGMQIAVSGSATAALNATYKITAVSGSTATITTSGVGNATYTDMLITTNNPVLNQSVWAIKALVYNATNQNTGSYWAGTGGIGGPQNNLSCANRANY